ncbi:MAG: hypothetical protein JW760_00065 [Spirochaetales bacterium]|nr:hypothetical protein [Spirochaetales bacterium]
MKKRDSFLFLIEKPWRKRFRLTRWVAFFLHGLLVVPILVLPAVFLPVAEAVFPLSVLLLLCFSALLLLSVLCLGYPVSREALYRKIDRHYELKGLLPTSLEVDTSASFSSLLQARSEDILTRKNPKEVFPILFRRRYLAIPFLFTALFLFSFSGLLKESAVQEEGVFLMDESRRLAARAEEADLYYTREFARRMSELAEELQNPSLGKQEALDRIEGLRSEVLGAVDDLERSWLSGGDETILPEPGQSGNGGGAEQTFQDTSVQGGMSSAEGGGRGEDTGDKSFHESGSEETAGDEGDLYRDKEPSEEQKEDLQGLKDLEESLSSSLSALEEKEGERGDTPADDTAASEERDEPLPEEDSNVIGAPGQEAQEDETGEMYQRKEENRPPGIPLEGTDPTDTGVMSMLLRTLPDYARAEMEEKDIPVEYQLSMEEALSREDIPWSLRRVISRYFTYTEASSSDTSR